MTRPTVAIVDPFSTGAQLAPEFARRGWQAIALLSTGGVPAEFRRGFRPEHYAAVLDASAGADVTAQLRAARPAYVITGSEWGVHTADALAEQLGLPGNGTELSHCRRDKFAMAERLRSQGVAAAASLAAQDVAEILAWADAEGHWPLVVKPLASAGSDAVAICENAAQVRKAFERIHGQTNQMGGYNDRVLAQELLVGEQYFVNSVSRDGKHFIHEIWREQRTSVDGAVVYDYQDLLAPGGATQRALTAYVGRVLDALGIAHGPAHAEVMLTARGPVLIEIGARLEGSVTSRGPRAATGHSQVSLTVDAYTEPARFSRLPGTDYRLLKRLRVVVLIASRGGRVAAAPLDELRRLPSYLCGSTDALQPGAPVHRTVDLFTSPGHLYLLGDDLDQVERDYRQVRRLEQESLYAGDAEGRLAP
ncbi:ATP-grasp domain-containing protein [Streptomyces cyaneogriseus]|uniref:ATP-grasp domain-containing protein n=1 Tax=Streptomyces cyaneogriseus TaxID=68192 RepID=UPI00069B67EB|nr:ATP-grasp domain-containing protein [Streptomyces cyaneogriseus]